MKIFLQVDPQVISGE